MLLAGDEFGRTQHGNNNAYCQDNAVSWLDWRLEPWQEDLLATTRFLLRLRREHPALRRDRFYTGGTHDEGTKDIGWFAADGEEMDHHKWQDARHRALQVYVHDPGERSLLVVVQGTAAPAVVTLPGPPWAKAYGPLWDSTAERPPAEPWDAGDGTSIPAGSSLEVAPASLAILRALRD